MKDKEWKILLKYNRNFESIEIQMRFRKKLQTDSTKQLIFIRIKSKFEAGKNVQNDHKIHSGSHK